MRTRALGNLLSQFWIKPLLEEDMIPAERRDDFVQSVFWNIEDVLKVNEELANALQKRQAEKHVVDQIGDIMLEYVTQFEPFVQYGAHQIIGKYVFETEKKTNPSFASFVEVELTSHKDKCVYIDSAL